MTQCIHARRTTSPKPTLFIICRLLVSEGSEVLLSLVVNLGRLLGLGHLPPCGLLALVVCGALDFSTLFQTAVRVSLSSASELPAKDVPSNDVLVLPAKLVTETADSAVLAAGLQPQYPQSLRNNNALLLVVWRRDTLEGL